MNKKKPLIIKFFKFDTSKRLSIVYILTLLILVKLLVNLIPLKYYYYKLLFNNMNCNIDLQPYYCNFRLFKKIIRKIPLKITCLEESLAMRLYFRKFNINLPVYLGIKIDSKNKLIAHAWSPFEDLLICDYMRIKY